eukprot:TRINITY_DN4219_c0_g1_i1.p1 TRINITY_DN4219_c0_g1~~TRINITY_DN4219_c0_g1_i1.p1  ORF type:complete len:447 (+),score=111.40 TRINITY_DN4219_c0_g1_i1:73-1413(+)
MIMAARISAVAISVIFSIFAVSNAAYCNDKPSPNWSANNNSIFTGDPTFVRSVKNGVLYSGGADDFVFSIAHVYGTPYEMGYAHGQLFKEELEAFVPALWNHLYEEFEDDDFDLPTWLPPDVAKWIAETGLDVLLDFTEDATAEYTPSYWFEEMQGLADGVNNASAVTKEIIYRLSLLGELTKGTCSMFGAWGEAVANVPGVELLQLRALDWETDDPFPLYPTIVVYHPTVGNSFANVGWPGWVGSISGMSNIQTAISEIGVYWMDKTWGEESRFGYPFTYVLRDLLQFDSSVDDATNRLANTKRTCDLLFGFGDGKKAEFRGYQYGAGVLNVYNDQNLEPFNETWHPRVNDLVYWGMDWDCPPYNQRLYEIIDQYYGSISVENAIKYILPATQTGKTHALLYDLTNNFMYYSHVGLVGTPNRNAYERTYTRLNMTALFEVQNPSL